MEHQQRLSRQRMVSVRRNQPIRRLPTGTTAIIASIRQHRSTTCGATRPVTLMSRHSPATPVPFRQVINGTWRDTERQRRTKDGSVCTQLDHFSPFLPQWHRITLSPSFESDPGINEPVPIKKSFRQLVKQNLWKGVTSHGCKFSLSIFRPVSSPAPRRSVIYVIMRQFSQLVWRDTSELTVERNHTFALTVITDPRRKEH